MALYRLRLFVFLIAVSSFCLSEANHHRVRIQLTGYLVDIACAADPGQSTPGWAPKHSRECLLMPACVRSGYALLTDNNELIRFDAAGNKLAQKLILSSARNNDFRVRVSGYRAGDQLAVSRIEESS